MYSLGRIEVDLLCPFLIYNRVVLSVSVVMQEKKTANTNRVNQGQPVGLQKISILLATSFPGSSLEREKLGNDEVDLLVDDREFKERVKNICIQKLLA